MWRARGLWRIWRKWRSILHQKTGTGRWGQSLFWIIFLQRKRCCSLDEPIRLKEKADEVEEEYVHSRQNREEAGVNPEENTLTVYPVREIIDKMNRYSGIACTTLNQSAGTSISAGHTAFRQRA